MEGGTTSLANFAIKSLNSSSSTSEIQSIGVLLLDSLLHERDSSDKLMSNIIHSEEALSKVFGMLGRSDARGGDIRLFAARVTAKLSSRINYALIPGTVKLFSSLLDSENQPQIASGNSANSGCSQPRDDLLEHGESNIGCSWVCRRWQPIKDKWSIPGEPPLTSEDSLPVLGLVMETIMSAKGKHLESLIGLASQICGVIPYSFVHELESHTNGDVLVQNLVRTLNANWIPDHQYPRMRRVIVEAVISIVESCPRYATLFRRAGMIKALHEVQRWTPFETEKYRAFCEGTGVILQSGPPLSALVERAESHEINEAAPMDDMLPHPSSKA
ncbi:hypothetical protein EJB05_17820, partial [Eragrostis curvula]